MEAPEQRDEKPGSTESPVREGKRPGLAPDSGYDPSLRAEELDTPKQRLTYSEVPDHLCGLRDETKVRYTTFEHRLGRLQAVMCPRGLVLVLEAPRGQRAVALALALALITKSLALALALVPKSLALVLALRESPRPDYKL